MPDCFVVGSCLMFPVCCAGFPAAYAAYAAGRSYSGYPSFGLPYPAGNPLTSLHHQLSGNHYHHLATLLPYHPLELSGVYNVHAMHL